MELKCAIISLGSDSSKMLVDEARQYFSIVDSIDLKKIEIHIDRKKKAQVLNDGEPMKEYDCIYMKGSYRYASLLYGLSEVYKNKAYLPIESNAHMIAHNKFMMHMFYASNAPQIPMPATYFAANVSETKAFLKTLNYPMILKIPSGTHGKGVIFTNSYASASSMIDALEIFRQPVIIQEYINVKSDIRVIVAGNKIVGAMRRIAQNEEVRANAHLGAEGEPYVPTPEIKRISLEAAEKVKAHICAIDVIESEFGPLILEINTSPGLQKITEVTKKNIAKEIAEYLYEETKKFKEAKNKVLTTQVLDEMDVENVTLTDIQMQLNVKNGKILLPEFALQMSKFKENEEVVFKVTEGKIEITTSPFTKK